MTRLIRLAIVSLFSLATVSPAMAQKPANLAGCVTKDEQTTCDWYWFHKTLDSSRTVAVESSNMDRSTGAQLRNLATSLGKTIAATEEAPDLILEVSPATVSGVDFGPADEEILSLNIYSGAESQRKLVWVETYRGQKDRPWPANVHAVIAQFQRRLSPSRTPSK